MDLVDHRNSVTEALERLGSKVGRMEVFGARPDDATQASIKDLEESDLFVGFYAYRYGYISTAATVSITEQEYDQARILNKPMFCFLIDENFNWLPKNIEDEPGKSKLRDFKEKITADVVHDVFTTPDSLAAKVVAAVGRYITHSEHAADKAEIAKSLAFYGNLHGILKITRDVFEVQINRRDDLWRTLRAKKPEQVSKYESIKNNRIIILFEKGFEELYPSMDENDLQLYRHICQLTEYMSKYNSDMLKLLDDNYDYFIDIPELEKLHRHLIAWVTKFKSLRNKLNVCLVYVGVEEGEPFPTEIEDIIEERLKKVRNRLS